MEAVSGGGRCVCARATPMEGPQSVICNKTVQRLRVIERPMKTEFKILRLVCVLEEDCREPQKSGIKQLKEGEKTQWLKDRVGGVQECTLMTPGQETIFLRKRFGFVRCAIETGAPLVPVLCFGQSEAYHYLTPTGKWYSGLSRMLRFTPLIFWGMYGSFIPFRQAINVVVGKPIEVTKNAKPSRDEVAALLETFIGAMEELFEKHKAGAGYKDTKLIIL